MLLGMRVIETIDIADFYFDPKEKQITGEFNEAYIKLSVKGEFWSRNYVNAVFDVLERKSRKCDFDDCSTFEDLETKEI